MRAITRNINLKRGDKWHNILSRDLYSIDDVRTTDIAIADIGGGGSVVADKPIVVYTKPVVAYTDPVVQSPVTVPTPANDTFLDIDPALRDSTFMPVVTYTDPVLTQPVVPASGFFLETDPALRDPYYESSIIPDMTTATAEQSDPYKPPVVTFVDPVLSPVKLPTNTAELEAQLAAEKWAADQAKLAAAQAAAAEVKRLAEAEAARQAALALAAQYKTQRDAEALALQAEAARLRAIQVAKDQQATADQLAWAQAEAERIALEAKKKAEQYAAEQLIAKKATDAASKAAEEYASSLVANLTPSLSDESGMYIAGAVAVVGLLALLIKN